MQLRWYHPASADRLSQTLARRGGTPDPQRWASGPLQILQGIGTAIVSTISTPCAIIVVAVVATVLSPPMTGRSIVPVVVALPDAAIANAVLSLFPPPPPLSPCLPPLPCRAAQTPHAQYQQPGAPIGEAKVHHPVPAGPYQLIALAHGQALLGYALVGAQHGLQPRAKGVTHPHSRDLPYEVLGFLVTVVAVCAIFVQHHVTVRGIEFCLHPCGQQPVIP
jgi:hypothetical protein